jgi:hypothetical protein
MNLQVDLTDGNSCVTGNSMNPGVNYGILTGYALSSNTVGVATFSNSAPGTLTDNSINSVAVFR